MVLKGLYEGGNNSEEDNDREKHSIRNMKCTCLTQWRIVKQEDNVKEEDGQSTFTARSRRATSYKIFSKRRYKKNQNRRRLLVVVILAPWSMELRDFQKFCLKLYTGSFTHVARSQVGHTTKRKVGERSGSRSMEHLLLFFFFLFWDIRPITHLVACLQPMFYTCTGDWIKLGYNK